MIARRSLFGALLTLPMLRVARGQVAHRLTVVHLNDFHSRHDPVGPATLACSVDAPGCFGGSPRLATAIRSLRAAVEAAGRAVLLLDAGDQFQGSLFFTALHGEAELAVMRATGTEAMAVGNHEFDAGPDTLARFIRAAPFPVLSANTEAGGVLAGLIHPWTLFQRAGLRIAVVGLTTPEALTGSSPGPDVRIGPPGPALRRAAAEARAAGAQAVVVLSHLGLPEDRALAAAVPNLAAIVGGHTHTLLSNTEPGAAGPAPVMVSGVPIVQAGAYGRFLGRLDLDLAADGTLLAWGADCRHVGPDTPEDPAVAALVASYAAPLQAARRAVLGQVHGLDSVLACRVAPCPIGRFVAEAMLAAAHADVALMNAGGIRTGLPDGSVTRGDLDTALPFGNTLATATLSGADLQAAVLHGLAQAGRGGFPQLAGMRMGLAGLEIRGADGRFAPVDPAARFRLATNNFIRTGGDGYAVLRDRAADAYDTGPLVADAVAAAIGRD